MLGVWVFGEMMQSVPPSKRVEVEVVVGTRCSCVALMCWLASAILPVQACRVRNLAGLPQMLRQLKCCVHHQLGCDVIE